MNQPPDPGRDEGPVTGPVTGPDTGPDLSQALEVVESFLLGEAPGLTRIDVAERAGVPIEIATELWRLLGFAQLEDTEVAFTPADVEALTLSADLMRLGILTPERQAALVRTWGRSFARLAEWQTDLLVTVALETDGTHNHGDNPENTPGDALATLTEDVLPRVEALQSYVWRRHLASAANRMLDAGSPTDPARTQAVVFVDIVGYTSHSRTLSESELVSWLEHFENATLDIVVDHGGHIIKNIGDEVLLVADDLDAAIGIADAMVRRGSDEDDRFPAVRAGIAYGDVVNRLGDVFGPTVNVAARLTSVARPGTIVVDQGVHNALADGPEEGADGVATKRAPAYSLRRIHRVSVKGYDRLPAWALKVPARK